MGSKCQEMLSEELVAKFQEQVWDALKMLADNDNIKVRELVRDKATAALLEVFDAMIGDDG